MGLLFGGVMMISCSFVAGNLGAAGPVIHVQVGGTAVLQYDFGDINLENETFDGRRINMNYTDSNPHVYSRRGGVENFEPQADSYKGRVYLNVTYLRAGVVHLEIRGVNLSDSGEYLLTIPKLNMSLSVVLDVKEAEMKKTDGNGFNTTTHEGTKGKGWYSVIPVAAAVIIAGVLLKTRPWSPKDGEKRRSNEMI